MKTKGISFWERHVEHIAIGVAALIFVGLAAMQFLGSPNSVDHMGTNIGPGEVDRMLEEKAREIAAQISSDAPSPIPQSEATPLLAKFQQQKSASISPQTTLLAWQPSVHPGGDYVVEIPPGHFVVPEIAAPKGATVRQYFDTLQEETVSAQTELQKILAAPPFDLSWMTVAATFDFAAVRNGFSTDSNGARALPAPWYGNGPDVVDVQIHREELMPDGSFGNLVLIDPLPGRESFRAQIAGTVDAATRDDILDFLEDPAGRNEIIQPEFYDGLADAWIPPDLNTQQPSTGDAKPEVPAEVAELQNLKSQLNRLTAERDRVAAKMKENGCSEVEPEAPKKEKDDGKGSGGGGPAAPGGGGGGFSGGGDGGGGGGLRDPQGAGTGDKAGCKSLRIKIKRLKVRIEKLEQEIAKLEPKAPQEQPKPDEQKKVEEPLPDVVTVWGHDITVQPGKTYRYRMTIHIYNPLFLHKADLMPDQQPMADQFFLASKTSEWTAPTRVEPPLRVFVIHANPNTQATAMGGLPSGQATAEVFRYFNGRWWSDRFSVKPGDRVGGEKPPRRGDGKSAPIDFGSEWFVLDVVEDVGGPKSTTEDGLGGYVVLQNLSDISVTQNRDPKDDRTSHDLQWLRDMVTEANVDSPVAAR
jgi:hypothetical protein